MTLILSLWRRRLVALSDRFREFIDVVIDDGAEWFLISMIVILLLVVGFSILVVIYDPMEIKILQWHNSFP